MAIYGASVTKKSLAGWLHAGGSSREDIEDNVSVLRQRTRDLYMGVPLANGAVKNHAHQRCWTWRLKSTIDAETLGISPEERRKPLKKRLKKSGLSGLKAMPWQKSHLSLSSGSFLFFL